MVRFEMQKIPGIKINLGKREARITSADLFKWVTHTGRIIVVGTELIALAALLYRFVLDMQINDLHDQIRQERVFLKAREREEVLYKNVQEKLTQIDVLPKESYALVKMYSDVLEAVQDTGISDTRFTIGKSSVAISGRAISFFTLNQYIERLKGMDQIIAINLEEVARQQEGVRFSLMLELKGVQLQ